MAEKQAKTKSPSKTRKTAPAAKGNGKKSCVKEGCKRSYRAKGLCFFHYNQWRRGELKHGRYRTCSNAECKKRVFKSGMCETHFKEARHIVDAPAAAAASPTPAPAAA